MSRIAVKVLLPLNRSIILASVIVELEAYPLAYREMRGSIEANCPLSPVGVLDSRPR